ncbi:MAG: hypothetical protein ABGX16_08685 [Pirellulales bacterium]
MEQSELLRHLCTTLDRLAIRYLVTGSQATIAYGEPRFTNDIDVVIDLSLSRLDDFCAAFPDNDYYLSRTAAQKAIQSRSMFNIIHPTSGLKINVILPKNTLFDLGRFDRGHRVQVAADYQASFASPEDVILKKLEFYKLGGSDKHLRDIAGVIKLLGEELDHQFISNWAQQLEVADIWQAILTQLEET